MIIFDPQELKEIIQAVSSANNTDAMPAHSWARASKVLLDEVERLRSELEKKESQNDSLREMVSVSAVEVERLRQALNIYANDQNWWNTGHKEFEWQGDEEFPSHIARRALEGNEVEK